MSKIPSPFLNFPKSLARPNPRIPRLKTMGGSVDNNKTSTAGIWLLGGVSAALSRVVSLASCTTKKYTSVMICVCHSRSCFLSCMYIHDDFMTGSR